MATSQQQWRRGSQFLLLAAALVLVLLIAAGGADAKCSSGYSVCDGKCVNLNTDPYNCAYCHHVCKTYPHATSKCKYGQCTWECNYLYGNCDNYIKNGCEKYLGYDENNCGYCGHVCLVSPDYKYGEAYCSGGKCYSRCPSGWKYNPKKKECYK